MGIKLESGDSNVSFEILALHGYKLIRNTFRIDSVAGKLVTKRSSRSRTSQRVQTRLGTDSMIENKSKLIIGDARTANMPNASLLKYYLPIHTGIY